jgi:catechol 2,3-dioxygenase-like lactoylglutathione lyase family enzyme
MLHFVGVVMKGLLFTIGIASGLLAQNDADTRPKVLGIAHVAWYVKDLARSRQFYEDFLGFSEPSTYGGLARTAIVRVNDQQYFELHNEPDRGEGQLHHIALYTDHAARMGEYLKSKSVEVTTDDDTGNFTMKDPDGHRIEMIEYRPAVEDRTSMPATRISDHLAHAGVLVGDLEKALAFYRGVLGFEEFWRGSSSPEVLSWVNMRVPDGQDYIEFMLYDQLPEPGARGSRHHASLWISDADQTLAELRRRAARTGYATEIKIQTGVNRKRQINLYDPDGTRIELMERNTVDGRAAPSSSAPPPRHID